MRIAKTLFLIVILLLGAFVLYHRDKIGNPGDLFSLLGKQLNFFSSSLDWQESDEPGPSDRIAIASFKLSPNANIARDQNRLNIIADICMDFDVVALQLDSPNPQLLSSLVSLINENDADYKYIQDNRNDGYAVLFKSETVELESNHHYSVNDPEGLFQHPPLVAWFRARKAPPQEAFTFTLANFKTGNQRAEKEREHLDLLFRAIREDGRGEDDVLLVGDFGSDAQQLSGLKKRSGLVHLISSKPTTVNQNEQLDNILFHQSATVEHDVQGVVDFMRRYNLRLADALDVSDRNPVWAEFSVYEGRKPEPRHATEEPFRRRKNIQHPASIPTMTSPKSLPTKDLQG